MMSKKKNIQTPVPQAEENPAVEEERTLDLTDPESIRQAIIAAEILNRKY
ncbi:MAG: hypothetical protein IKN59_06270 [Paludibacteraceae bacterium]|nr:hypothetical protein [Paludibacteraceae bacterium]